MEKEKGYNRQQLLQFMAKLLCDKKYLTPEEYFMVLKLIQSGGGHE